MEFPVISVFMIYSRGVCRSQSFCIRGTKLSAVQRTVVTPQTVVLLQALNSSIRQTKTTINVLDLCKVHRV